MKAALEKGVWQQVVGLKYKIVDFHMAAIFVLYSFVVINLD